jgi:hypothetical protein
MGISTKKSDVANADFIGTSRRDATSEAGRAGERPLAQRFAGQSV